MNIKENSVYSKHNDPLFFVIKNIKDNTYFGYHFTKGTPEDDDYNLVEWTKDLDNAEAFDDKSDAVDNLDAWIEGQAAGRFNDEEEELNWKDEEALNYKIIGIKSIKFTE